MGGKSKKTIIGYWYKWLAHFIFSKGPVDAVLELRGGDKTMWSGRATSNTRISVNKPSLFGGVSAAGGQGGVQTDIDLMFGAADQAPNDYLGSVLGPRQTGHRRKQGIVLRGGKFGAFSSSPQTVSAKLERVLADWPDDTPWYPEKAVIQVALVPASKPDWRILVLPEGDTTDCSAESFDDSAWTVGAAPIMSSTVIGWDVPATFGFSNAPGTIVPQQRVVWMRSTLNLAKVPDSLTFDALVDNGITVWVNGALVLSDYDAHAHHYVTTLSGSLFRVGANIIAVKGVDDGLGNRPGNFFYFDVRLRDINPLNAINPAHALYLSIVHPDAQGEPIGSINDASFRAAADRLYTEAFGICATRDPAKETPRQFQDRICNLIGGQVNQSRVDGLYYLDLVRDLTDAEYAALPIITEDDVRQFSQEPNVIADATNCIIGKWRDPTTKADYTTRPLESPSAIRASGQRVVETKEYYELPYEDLCLRVCQRDLNMSTLPRSHINLTCLRRVAALRPCQQFRLQMPSEGIADMLLVLAKIDRGSPIDGKVQIEALTNVVGLPRAIYVSQSDAPWQAPDSTAVAPTSQLLMEAPYIELVSLLAESDLAALSEEAGYIATAAVRPAAGIGYRLATATGAGAYTTGPDTFDFTPSALMSAAGQTETVIPFTDGVDIPAVNVGDWALWDAEIVRVDALDATAGTVTLGRGCADTVPVSHAAASRILFVGQDAGSDRVQYVGGETVHAKILTVTTSSELDQVSAAVQSVTLGERAARPYAPGMVKVGGEYYPATVSDTFTVTWAHRNRVTQADQLVDTTQPSISPAANIRYALRFLDDSDTLLVERTDIGDPTASVVLDYTGIVTMELYTIDNFGASFQRHSFSFDYTPPAGSVTSTITATPYTPVDDSTIIDGGTI